jgi:hypothetical protein
MSTHGAFLVPACSQPSLVNTMPQWPRMSPSLSLTPLAFIDLFSSRPPPAAASSVPASTKPLMSRPSRQKNRAWRGRNLRDAVAHREQLEREQGLEHVESDARCVVAADELAEDGRVDVKLRSASVHTQPSIMRPLRSFLRK